MFTHELQYYCLHDCMFSHKSLEIGVDFTIVFLILSVELVVHLPRFVVFFLTIACQRCFLILCWPSWNSCGHIGKASIVATVDRPQSYTYWAWTGTWSCPASLFDNLGNQAGSSKTVEIDSLELLSQKSSKLAKHVDKGDLKMSKGSKYFCKIWTGSLITMGVWLLLESDYCGSLIIIGVWLLWEFKHWLHDRP